MALSSLHGRAPRSGSAQLWVLNLDGEHELEAGRRYAPTEHLKRLVERARQGLWSGPDPLVRPGAWVLADPASDPRGVPPGGAPLHCLRVTPEGTVAELVTREQLAQATARAWLPTERARALLSGLGMQLESAPTQAVLAAVNARDFAVAPRAAFVGEAFDKHVALDEESALRVLALPAPGGWMVRRRFGAAGRGRRRFEGGLKLDRPVAPRATPAARLSAADRSWLRASLRLGPVVLEPWVEITTEFTRSGFVTRAGDVLVSAPCFQATDRAGAWTHTECAGTGEVARADDEVLAGALEAAGRALAAQGYFGPFGIDAFRYRDPRTPGRTRLNPLSEINARYTMDWALAMGAARLRSSLEVR